MNSSQSAKDDWQPTVTAPTCSVGVEATVDRHPMTVAPSTAVETVIRWMSQGYIDTDDTGAVRFLKSVSYVLIAEKNRLIGIFTERDIVKLTAQGTDFAGLSIGEIMTNQPITLSEDALADCLIVLSVFRQHGIRHLPILDRSEQIIGVATPNSICQAVQPTVLLKLRQIEEVMVTGVVASAGDTTALVIAQKMASARVSCVVITSTQTVGESAQSKSVLRPIGILTERDIVRFRASALELSSVQAQVIMSAPLTCLSPADSLWAAHQTMQRLGVKRLVIVDDDQAVAGVVTQTSLLSVLNPLEICTAVNILQQQVESLQSEKVKLLRSLNQSLTVQVKNDESRFRKTFEQAAAGIVHVDLNGCYVQVNQRFCEMLGYSHDDLIGKAVLELTHPNSRDPNSRLIQQLIQGEIKSFKQEKQYCCSDGSTIWVSVIASSIDQSQGTVDCLTAVIEDISDRKKNEAELTLHRHHLEELVEARTVELQHEINERRKIEQQLFSEKELAQVTLHSIGDAVITTDAQGLVSYLNPIAEKLTGWSYLSALKRPLNEIFVILNETTRKLVQSPVERVLSNGCATGLANNTILVAKEGTEYGIDDSAAPLRNRDGKMIGAVMVFRDATHARQVARQLSWQAGHDALTGLVNRRQFEQVLAEAHEVILPGQQHVLCYLDLDQFKVVNDTCGHTAGDEMLRQVSVLLSRQVRAADTLARLGGDEFAILLYQCPLNRASLIADQIREAVTNFRFCWQGITFRIGVSVGLVVIDTSSQTVMTTLSAADTACYTAKSKGRNRVQVYQPDSAEIIRQRGQQQWSLRIKQALEMDQFCLYQQKIVPTDKSVSTHTEILLRMVNESGDLILPGAFIPAAERYDLMPDIDQWVVRSFFSYLSNRHLPALPSSLYMINLSGASVGNDRFLTFLKAQLNKYEIDPKTICFEITETAVIANLNQAIDFIGELKQLGFCFALDDFGSGMSSFAYLKTLPVDYIKIDGKFITDLSEDETALAIVEAISDIGHVMGLQTIAEFVGDRKVQDMLGKIGVDFMQGYGIERPYALI